MSSEAPKAWCNNCPWSGDPSELKIVDNTTQPPRPDRVAYRVCPCCGSHDLQIPMFS